MPTLLRFTTAGSVDDGKSTLIGRLLYDTKSIFADQLDDRAARRATAATALNLALLTDGLRAEREQGITIDVAYRYFATAKRKFIIADTPGHVQYTRNMVTGASTADLAIVLVDARSGVRRADPPPRLHRVAARHPAPRGRRQQDGPRRLGRGGASTRSSASSARFRSQLAVPDTDVHPDQRAARRQRRRALARRCPGTTARRCSSTSRPSQVAGRPQPVRAALPGAVGDPPTASTRLPRLRRPGGRRRAAPRRRGRRAAVRRVTHDRLDRHLRRRRSTRPFPPMSVTVHLADDLDVSRGDLICGPATARRSRTT